MLPDIQKADPLAAGARLGKTWNAIRARLFAQKLLGSASIRITETARGQLIDRVGFNGATSSATTLGFAVTITASGVVVAPGRVVTQAWSGATGNDFKPSDWAEESNFTGATLAAGTTSVWLKVEFTETDMTSEGDLLSTNRDISGGAGGKGGGGGGGGAANGDTAILYVTNGATGTDGVDGGAGGAGGKVYVISNNNLAGATGGYGADGDVGGAGGAGADGTSVTYTRYTKATSKVRHYTLSNISAQASKGTNNETATWVRLATITSGTVSQHHIGTLRIMPAVLTFVPI